jgi:diguanylate cyclase (GGDEF)-like protein
LRRLAVAGLLALTALVSHAEQAAAPAATVAVRNLGEGTVAISGPWEFHVGDDPAWAAPGFDDSGWQRVTADKPWGDQGHMRYVGFAWYRCHLRFATDADLPPELSILLRRVDNAYQIYWNGVLIGQNGRMPPHPVWYVSEPPQVFSLGLTRGGEQAQSGVLAVRVWKAPLLSDDPGERGGFEVAPEVGSARAIATARAALDYQWLASHQFLLGENLLYAVIALLSFLTWVRHRKRWVLFWMTLFAVSPVANFLLLDAHIRWPYGLSMGAAQPASAMGSIALWFLLLWLLDLRENRALHRLTIVLAWTSLINCTLDGIAVSLSGSTRWIGLVQRADLASTIVQTPLEIFPLVLVAFAVTGRKRPDATRWLLAGLAFLDQMIVVSLDVLEQGRQYTGWSIPDRIEAPLFTFGRSAITPRTITAGLLIVSIAYMVYMSFHRDEREREAMEREKAELQRASEQMRHYAEHDGLTGLWNHRIMMERLRGEVERSRRDGTPLSVILADIDHFKKINDEYGHPVGDLVLKEISVLLERLVRPYDWVGRYGGEEFLIILPGSDFDAACVRAEQLRRAVEMAEIGNGETALRVTSSFGVASGRGTEHDAEEMIRIVDAALYRAKASGRNCVIAASMDVAAGERLMESRQKRSAGSQAGRTGWLFLPVR